MNTRLKIICILFGVAYFYFVGNTIIDEIPSMVVGFNEGLKSHESSHETVFFNVKPASGFYSFPTSFINLKTGIPIQTELSYFIAKIDKTQLPQKIKIGEIVLLLFVIPMIFVIIFIPIQTYRVIRSIIKDGIFNIRNINRIRWIGYSLLFMFVMEMYANLINTAQSRALISLEDYRIVFNMSKEYYWLLFALVTLMFAEILKISHTIKAEQDLTI